MIGDWFTKIRLGVAIARAATGGKHGKIFDKIDEGTAIAEKATEISELIKQMAKKKKTGKEALK